LRVRKDVPSLRSRRLVEEVERSFRCARERGRFRLVHYSIQTNHVHMIVEAASSSDLGNGMKSLGSRLARAVNRIFRRAGPVLADRFHVHALWTPREVRNALAYVSAMRGGTRRSSGAACPTQPESIRRHRAAGSMGGVRASRTRPSTIRRPWRQRARGCCASAGGASV
jgi:REP element-mobilizing transposase RayT